MTEIGRPWPTRLSTSAPIWQIRTNLLHMAKIWPSLVHIRPAKGQLCFFYGLRRRGHASWFSLPACMMQAHASPCRLGLVNHRSPDDPTYYDPLSSPPPCLASVQRQKEILGLGACSGIIVAPRGNQGGEVKPEQAPYIQKERAEGRRRSVALSAHRCRYRRTCGRQRPPETLGGAGPPRYRRGCSGRGHLFPFDGRSPGTLLGARLFVGMASKDSSGPGVELRPPARPPRSTRRCRLGTLCPRSRWLGGSPSEQHGSCRTTAWHVPQPAAAAVAAGPRARPRQHRQPTTPPPAADRSRRGGRRAAGAGGSPPPPPPTQIAPLLSPSAAAGRALGPPSAGGA